MKKQAFTLVELIVVITILAILATIGFVSFSGYLAGTRDTNRIAQLKSMSDALELYRTKKDLPIPDDKVDVQASGTTIAYQGYIGANVLETIEYTEKGLDPKDKTYFSYYLTKNKKYFQLLGFLEETNTDVVASVFQNTKAVDYTNRFPKVTGKKLGILTDTNNTPIQEIVTITASGYLDLGLTATEYVSHLKDNKTHRGIGVQLLSGIISSIVGKNYKDCKEILSSKNGLIGADGMYWITPDSHNPFQVYCDMTTDGGGWTLVFVQKGAESINVHLNPINEFSTNKLSRDFISSTSDGTRRDAEYYLLEDWPYYDSIYWERWLPETLVGRSYAAPGFSKTDVVTYTDSETNVNYLSHKRSSIQGWNFTSQYVNGHSEHITTPKNTKVYYTSCGGCASGNLYTPLASRNGFFPDRTYGYWRISTTSHYNQHWTEYDNLSDGDPMPGYALYIR